MPSHSVLCRWTSMSAMSKTPKSGSNMNTPRSAEKYLGEYAFSCPIAECPYRSKGRGKIPTHVKSCHSDPPKKFKCTKCTYSAPYPFQLNEHVKLHELVESHMEKEEEEEAKEVDETPIVADSASPKKTTSDEMEMDEERKKEKEEEKEEETEEKEEENEENDEETEEKKEENEENDEETEEKEEEMEEKKEENEEKDEETEEKKEEMEEKYEETEEKDEETEEKYEETEEKDEETEEKEEEKEEDMVLAATPMKRRMKSESPKKMEGDEMEMDEENEKKKEEEDTVHASTPAKRPRMLVVVSPTEKPSIEGDPIQVKLDDGTMKAINEQLRAVIEEEARESTAFEVKSEDDASIGGEMDRSAMSPTEGSSVDGNTTVVKHDDDDTMEINKEVQEVTGEDTVVEEKEEDASESKALEVKSEDDAAMKGEMDRSAMSPTAITGNAPSVKYYDEDMMSTNEQPLSVIDEDTVVEEHGEDARESKAIEVKSEDDWEEMDRSVMFPTEGSSVDGNTTVVKDAKDGNGHEVKKPASDAEMAREMNRAARLCRIKCDLAHKIELANARKEAAEKNLEKQKSVYWKTTAVASSAERRELDEINILTWQEIDARMKEMDIKVEQRSKDLLCAASSSPAPPHFIARSVDLTKHVVKVVKSFGPSPSLDDENEMEEA